MEGDTEDLGGCPRCAQKATKDLILNVRGKVACLRCQLDYVWDYIEENRRRQALITEKIAPPPRINWGDASKEQLEEELERLNKGG